MSAIDSVSAASIAPAGRWSIDASRSSVAFAVRHMMVATLKGRFREFEGTLEVSPGGVAEGFGTVKAASIDTNEPVRDEHVRHSADFFDVEHYPEISFASRRINQLESRRFRIVGDLTMRGVTQEIELDAQPHAATRDASGKRRIAFELHGELNRRRFGLSWNQALEAGGVLVGERVKIALEISAVQIDAA
jgi:polyisoprenoid-binding protein YceI